MTDNVYCQGFMALGISVEPLPSNYSPEEFGRSLFSLSQNETGVSYAASTDFSSGHRNQSDMIQEKQCKKEGE